MGILPRQKGQMTLHDTTMSSDEYKVTDPDLVDKFDTDKRGRLRLGTDFSNQRVKVAVQRIDDEDSSGGHN